MTRTEAQVNEDINNAISNGDLGRTTLLLDEWASLFSTPPKLDFLELASQTGSASIVSLLLSRGLDSDYYTKAIIAACEPEYHIDVLQAFLDSGWDINTYLGMGDLLFLCLDSPSMVKWAIEHGADPNENHVGWYLTNLESAVINESLETVEILIDMGGAWINNTNALKFAARYGRADMVELLLEKGAKIDEIPRRYDEDVSMHRDTGMGTALHQAAVAGQLEVVQFLLKKGADPRLKNAVGKTALELAREENHAMLVDVLESSV
ncbi:hypothetical protein C0992_013293 [Termitomyces sp. T32_za158]|nr:hypothetical protein C0992_013293 [Termitomyces sp. T32_za158]